MVTKDTFIRGSKNGLETILLLSKVIIPVYILITILKHTFVLDLVAGLFEPLMTIFGLPGEAAIVLVLGNTLSLYAGVGALASLSLSIKQITIISIMLSFSHSLPMETAVSTKLGVNVYMVLFTRIGLALLSGAILNLVM